MIDFYNLRHYFSMIIYFASQICLHQDQVLCSIHRDLLFVFKYSESLLTAYQTVTNTSQWQALQ